MSKARKNDTMISHLHQSSQPPPPPSPPHETLQELFQFPPRETLQELFLISVGETLHAALPVGDCRAQTFPLRHFA